MIVKCEQCGKEFDRVPSHIYNHIFCSRQCCSLFSRKRIKVECTYCGKLIERTSESMVKRKKIYCSQDCANKGKVVKKKYACDNCGKSVLRHPRKQEQYNHVFCSPNCYGEYRNRHLSEYYDNLVDKQSYVCETCGKVFFREPSKQIYKHTYCSSACQYKSMIISIELECENCGKIFKRKLSQVKRAKHCFCSKECADQHRKGEYHYNWNGWKSLEPYGIMFNKSLKESVRARDNYVCQECGIPQSELGYALHVHHTGYDKKRNNPSELISLCRKCHLRTNYNREWWIEYFGVKLMERYEPLFNQGL